MCLVVVFLVVMVWCTCDGYTPIIIICGYKGKKKFCDERINRIKNVSLCCDLCGGGMGEWD